MLLKNSLQDISPIERELGSIELPPATDVAALFAWLLSSKYLAKAESVFNEYPGTALLGQRPRALLYILTLFLKPHYVLEIGTYKAGSSEIITRALRSNNQGTLITVDPFGQKRIPPILETWPQGLRHHIEFLPLTSMECFIELKRRHIFPELIFIDGDHSYEYALYDLQMAARYVPPGGIIILDNAELTGVYWAVKTFLSIHPDWSELGSSIGDHDSTNPFTTMKPSIPETTFLILQAPNRILINHWPRSFEMHNIVERGLAGLDLTFSGNQSDGLLNTMVYFRSFPHGDKRGEPEQFLNIASFPIKNKATSLHIAFPKPFLTALIPEDSFRTYEFIFTWLPYSGEEPLEMLTPPTPIKIG